MAYGKLAEGDRVFDAANNIDASPDDINEVQDQLKAMLGPLYTTFFGGVPCNDPGTVPNFNDWDLRGPGTGAVVADTGFWWWEASGNDVKIAFPLKGLRVGQKITELIVSLGGNTTATGGSVTLYHGLAGTALTPVDIDDTANCFQCAGGDDESDKITYSETLSLTVTSGHVYFVVIQASAANGAGNRIYDVRAEAQAGN